MLTDICKKDIDSEIDVGGNYFTSADNGRCYNCGIMGKCIDLNKKISFLLNCETCIENNKQVCGTCISYLTFLIENNKFNRLIRLNIEEIRGYIKILG